MPVESVEWDADNARELKTFLKTPTGRKIGVSLRALIVQQAIAATSAEGEKLFWQSGHASGVRWVAEYLDRMAEFQGSLEGPKDDRPLDNLNWLHGSQE